MTLVSIIICTRNRASYLRETLEAMSTLTVPGHLSAELIIVDNASTDGTADLVRATHLPDMAVRGMTEPTPGKSHGLNLALAAARGEVLLWTDDDVRPPRDWIGEMCEPILSGQADGVAGKLRMAPHLERPWMRRAHYDRLSDTRHMGDDFGSMIGANMAFHRRVLEKVPGFDTELGPGALGFAEETLFSFQIRKAGYHIVALPSVTVEHHFEPDRLRRRMWLKLGEAHGRGEAYLRRHWHQTPVRFPRLQLLMWTTALAVLRRIAPPPDLDTEGCDRREIRIWQNVCYFRGYLQERRKPPKYDREGLVKKTDPPARHGASVAEAGKG